MRADSAASGLEKLQAKMVERNEKRVHPMRDNRRYTLRGKSYIPFNKQERDAKRLERAESRRGGIEGMSEVSGKSERERRLKEESLEHSVSYDDLSSDDDLERELAHDKAQKELEEMEKLEEEELNYLIENMSLNKTP